MTRSYIPKWSFGADQRHFLYENDFKIYEGNKGPRQTFFGVKQDHMVDIVIPSKELATTTHNVFYTAKTSKTDGLLETDTVVDATYDNVIVYNTTQSSGKLKLEPLPNNNVSGVIGSIYVTNKDREYRFSEFRDYTIDNKVGIWDQSWDGVKSFPYVYIDKVVNSVNINHSKSMYDLPRFKDLYCGIRLFFKPDDNLKISLDNLFTKTQKRLR